MSLRKGMTCRFESKEIIKTPQNMTKEQLAKNLNGREFGDEIFESEEREAEASGLVVIFGYSDDNTEFRGAISDEVGCYNGATLLLHSRGVLPRHDDCCACDFCGYKAAAEKCAKVEALWCEEPGYSWTYKTEVPHATFEIVEDGEKYCRGIVIDTVSLPSI